MPDPPSSIIFQAGKLGHLEAISQELEWAQARLSDQEQIDRIYGISGGALVALAFTLAVSSELQPDQYNNCGGAILDIGDFVSNARSRDIRRLNLNPWYGINNLNPLRRQIERYLLSYGLKPDLMIAALPIELYLCAGDQDGTFSMFGPPNPELHFAYTWVQVGPPQDAPLVDALIAALSTSLSTEPGRVLGSLYRDCRPAINDASAIIADLEATLPRSIFVHPPHTPSPPWRLNWITSSFIMHRHHERNQAELARYYTDLLERHRALERKILGYGRNAPTPNLELPKAPQLTHIDLPYIGSTEAFTNMRQSVAQKGDLMSRFKKLLAGQFDDFDFSQPTNVIYGAGGFSGILAGLVTTRQVEAGFKEGGGRIRQIYGVSAGVLNGFFHAIQVAAQNHPDLYTPAAENALNDLERFFELVSPRKIASVNFNSWRFWQGWANLNPLEKFIRERLGAYTGSTKPETLTFDDIHLPLTVAVARNDGFTDFLGMARPERRMQFAGSEIRVQSANIIRSVIAGWSMNTYISPAHIGDQAYRDGGGSFYDPALFVACMDDHLQNLLNIHLDEPEGHSYNLPDRPSILRLIFDTHNYNFPEERRRMRLITDLLYKHFALRIVAERSECAVPNDFRQEWTPPRVEKILTERLFSDDKELG